MAATYPTAIRTCEWMGPSEVLVVNDLMAEVRIVGRKKDGTEWGQVVEIQSVDKTNLEMALRTVDELFAKNGITRWAFQIDEQAPVIGGP